VSEAPAVDVAETRRRLDDGAALLDVREAAEWAAGHAPEATWIPLGALDARQAELPTEQPLLVICRSGVRSGRAATALRAAGYDATNVAGGMQAWAAAGLTVTADGDAAGHVI